MSKVYTTEIVQDYRGGIAKQLRTLRQLKKLKQKTVAQGIGLNQARLSEFENNKGDLSFDDIERVAQFMGMSMSITFEHISTATGGITS